MCGSFLCLFAYDGKAVHGRLRFILKYDMIASRKAKRIRMSCLQKMAAEQRGMACYGQS